MKFPTGPRIELPKLRRKRDGEQKPEAAEKAEATPVQPSRAKSRPQPPDFVTDIYRDLRDRRLLVPALALIVAIIATPIALSASPEPAPPIAPSVASDEASAVAPAVLAESEVGVRDYRERLEELKRKNPFKAKFQFSPKEVSEQTQINEPAPTGNVTTPAGDGGDTPAGTGRPTEPPVSTAPKPQPQPGDGGGVELREAEVDVIFGKVGDTKRIDGVSTETPLPSKKRPVVLFAGFGDKLDRAAFLVSRRVVGTKGDGRCSPSAKECDLVTLKAGQARFFDVENANGTTTKFRLKVVNLRSVIVERG